MSATLFVLGLVASELVVGSLLFLYFSSLQRRAKWAVSPDERLGWIQSGWLNVLMLLSAFAADLAGRVWEVRPIAVLAILMAISYIAIYVVPQISRGSTRPRA